MDNNKFYDLIFSKNTEYIIEAHNAISAKIVENVGFRGVWGSGLTISATLGYRDNNEASCTEIFAIAESIARNIDIPVVLDIDTGYGNFNNARLCIEKAKRIGVNALCIEDKIFPKMNSFVNNNQSLIDIQTFENKIRAMDDKKHNDNSNIGIIARTEALIVNEGIDNALRRAEAYYKAGADAIFLHSKKNNIEEISSFMKYWGNICPIIISPTTYGEIDPSVYSELGISLVIWANHMMRASIKGMECVARKIYTSQNTKSIKDDICPLSKLFDLVNLQEYLDDEIKYKGR